MTDLAFSTEHGPLRDPVLIVGMGAPSNQTPLAAVAHALGQQPRRLLAEIEGDQFYDFSVARPLARIVDGERVIEWPSPRFEQVTVGDRDIVFLSGVEPHLQWKRFARAVNDFTNVMGIQEVVLLSAFGGATPHTRPTPLRWIPLSGDRHSARFGSPATAPQYQGPASFTMALATLLRDAGLEVGYLSVIAPFYIGVDPSPHALRALLTALASEYRLPVDLAPLDEQISQIAAHVRQQLETEENLGTFIANLEQQFDESRLLFLQPPAVDEARDGTAPAVLDTRAILDDVDALLRDHRGGAGGAGAGQHRSRD